LGAQRGDLGPTVAAGVPQVPQQDAALAFVASRIVKAFAHATDVPIALGVIPVLGELHLRAGIEKLFNLFDCAKPRFVHVDHHPYDDQPTSQFNRRVFPSGSFLVGNTSLDQARSSLDKAQANKYPLKAGRIHLTSVNGLLIGCPTFART